ncbi:Nif3-like dinuclear metal center hexameric protein [Protaetiibacter mangrovi]|uniref:GTP cyclohydrolase 1 type 2 homolog n=1 Tax=Protaetiibacter mangrovi TaxID=2970926 RepID=A0ABT1ZBP2_9MICO|nr:Nif3-like dinuclear metal center hexameric protein [Protaetiibacter mangrovi]MCS0498099.1 Nif3-like dinuclear metal center hexameric protein [Protaetiibacter mangrovi]TPW99045.1 Nif3-like dinuclear metal center hexameric protein [Schumannella luteola]
MAPALAHVIEVAHALWPLSGAEEWDAPGLVVGDPSADVEAIHLAVDAVADTVDEALDRRAQLLLTHHPLLLRGVTSVAEDRSKGAIVARLIRGGCALLAAHTNADVVADGTSAVLARRLGLHDVAPLVPSSIDAAQGLGRVGELDAPMTLGDLARGLQEILPATAQGIRGAGDYFGEVRRIAVCAGAGDSLLANPAVRAADVYITSDLRHHPASEAREDARLSGGPALLDISHWAAEWLWLDVAAAALREALPDVTVTVSELRTDPWDFALV